MYCIIFHIHYTASFCIKVFYIVLYYIVSCYIVLHDWAAVGIRKAPIMDPASYWISSWSPGTNERQPGSPWEFTVVEQFEGVSLCNLYMTIRIWRVSRICWLRLCVCASVCPIFQMKKIKQNARIPTFGPDFGYFIVVLRKKLQSFHWHHWLTFGKKKLRNFPWEFETAVSFLVTCCHLQPLEPLDDHWVNRHRQEIGFFVGGELPALGRPITINEAADHIFGSLAGRQRRLDRSRDQ